MSTAKSPSHAIKPGTNTTLCGRSFVLNTRRDAHYATSGIVAMPIEKFSSDDHRCSLCARAMKSGVSKVAKLEVKLGRAIARRARAEAKGDVLRASISQDDVDRLARLIANAKRRVGA